MKNKDGIIEGNCWLAYFDILGFKNTVRIQGTEGTLFTTYNDVLREIAVSQKYCDIQTAWFSDTFLFYANDDSLKSFVELQNFTTFFFFNMFLRKIPMRGCMHCGDFYANKLQNIYLGEGWITAHEQAESQQVIGFTMTKDAKTKLIEYHGQDNEWEFCKKYFWLEYDIPLKENKNCRLPVYNFKTSNHDCSALENDKKRLDNALNSMQSIAEWSFNQILVDKKNVSDLERIKKKYQNTFELLSIAYSTIK